MLVEALVRVGLGVAVRLLRQQPPHLCPPVPGLEGSEGALQRPPQPRQLPGLVAALEVAVVRLVEAVASERARLPRPLPPPLYSEGRALGLPLLPLPRLLLLPVLRPVPPPPPPPPHQRSERLAVASAQLRLRLPLPRQP